MPRPAQVDLTRTTFMVLIIGGLLFASLWILRPFIAPMIWAAMVVVATWPVMLRLQAALWGRRWLAVTAMSVMLMLLFVVPLTLAVATIVGNADRLAEWSRQATSLQLPEQLPHWLAGLPILGEALSSAWHQVRNAGLQGLLGKLQPYAGGVTRWFVTEAADLGFLMLQFLLTLAIAAVMYASGEEAAAEVRRIARRLGGERGDGAVMLARDAIRGVAYGVGLTAVVQAVLGAIGLALAGIPFVGLLTAVMFMLCIAQIGAVPVLVPATVWVFWNGDTGWGFFLVVWTLVVGTLDNVLRPIFIRMGADLPFLLTFAGVVGGLLAFGLVGIFVGPVLLAVAYTLIEAWVRDGEPGAPPAPPAA